MVADNALGCEDDEEDYDLTGASLLWRSTFQCARCLRCDRVWTPRVAAPKQCRWCKSRAWQTKPGTIRLGRPPAQPKMKVAKRS